MPDRRQFRGARLVQVASRAEWSGTDSWCGATKVWPHSIQGPVSTGGALVAIVEVPLGPPYGKVPVNTDLICAAIPDPAQPVKASDLLIDAAGGRSMLPFLTFAR